MVSASRSYGFRPAKSCFLRHEVRLIFRSRCKGKNISESFGDICTFTSTYGMLWAFMSTYVLLRPLTSTKRCNSLNIKRFSKLINHHFDFSRCVVPFLALGDVAQTRVELQPRFQAFQGGCLTKVWQVEHGKFTLAVGSDNKFFIVHTFLKGHTNLSCFSAYVTTLHKRRHPACFLLAAAPTSVGLTGARQRCFPVALRLSFPRPASSWSCDT